MSSNLFSSNSSTLDLAHPNAQLKQKLDKDVSLRIKPAASHKTIYPLDNQIKPEFQFSENLSNIFDNVSIRRIRVGRKESQNEYGGQDQNQGNSVIQPIHS